jgi:hypothetical protein
LVMVIFPANQEVRTLKKFVENVRKSVLKFLIESRITFDSLLNEPNMFLGEKNELR